MKQCDYRLQSLEKESIDFLWKSDTLKLPYNPEYYLATNGSLGYYKDRDLWVVGHFTGVMDKYGDLTTYVCRTLATDPETFTLKKHEEVIVCGNTRLYRPFNNERNWFCEMKEEADVSIETQLLASRLSKAFAAESDAQKRQIELALSMIKKGLPAVIVTSLLEELKTVDLTDPNQIEKMQYLSSFFQTLEKRDSNFFGIDLEIIDKKAQVTSPEIKQYDDLTTMNYLVKKEARKAFVDEMKEAGYDIEIIPNPVFFDEPKDEDIDNGTFDEAEPEEPEEQEETVEETVEEEVKDNGNNEN